MRAGPTTTSSQNLAFAAEQGIALVEQPLPAGQDGILRHIAHPVPICADESVHEAKTLTRWPASTMPSTSSSTSPGGLTAALVLRDRARELVSASWSAAWSARRWPWRRPSCWPKDADFVDLDGPLLLARDRVPGLVYQGSLVSPPEPALVGLSAPQARSAPARPSAIGIMHKNPSTPKRS